MIAIADLTRLTTSEWLALRRQGVGSSDAAAILGVSPYRTPLAVYAEKLGLLDPEESEAMRWGRRLEPVIAEAYAEETGRQLIDPRALYRHPEHAWCLATPDRLTADRQLVVEIKAVGPWSADDWHDEPPLHYQVQVQHLLAVTGLERASLVALIGGQRLVWRDLERHERFIRLLLEREREFWRRVELRDPPPPEAEDSREVLAALYPQDDGRTVVWLPPEAAEWDAQRERAVQELRHWQRVRDEAEARLKAAIGSATWGVLRSGVRYSWRLQTRTLPPTPERTESYRILRRHTGTGGGYGKTPDPERATGVPPGVAPPAGARAGASTPGPSPRGAHGADRADLGAPDAAAPRS